MKNDRVIFELNELYSKGNLNAGIDLVKCFAYGAFICDYRNGATYEALSLKSLGLKKGATLFDDLSRAFKMLDKDEKKEKENMIKGIDKDIKKSEKKLNSTFKTIASKTRVPLDVEEVKIQSKLEEDIVKKYNFEFQELNSVQLSTLDEVF